MVQGMVQNEVQVVQYECGAGYAYGAGVGCRVGCRVACRQVQRSGCGANVVQPHNAGGWYVRVWFPAVQYRTAFDLK